MATLTGEQLKDSYQSLVTIGDSITSDPTSGQLENGKGTPLTAVGIGTNTPSSFLSNGRELVLGNGSASHGMTIFSDSAGTGNLFFADGTTGDEAYRGFLRYAHSSDNMEFYTAGANLRMSIDSSGNVGIGTNSPSSYGKTTIALGAVGGNVLALQKDSGAVIAFYGASFNNTGLLESQSASGDMVFYTGTSGLSEKMRILSGGGITFNGDTATANALDDYEEGTFTPTIAFGGGSTGVTYTNASGYYTKIGNIVHFTALIDLSSKGTDTGDVTIGGLPFTATSASGRFPDVNTRIIQNVVVDTFLQSAVLNNTTTVGILQYNSTTDDQEYLTDADFSNNSELNVTGFYFT
jgi:hypothetical protein